MTDITKAGAFALGDRTVNRMGYGAMQLAGPGVFGPPKDRDAALAVLREAVASGVLRHIDVSDFYGPTGRIEIRKVGAVHPEPGALVTPRRCIAAPHLMRKSLARTCRTPRRQPSRSAAEQATPLADPPGPSPEGSGSATRSALADLQRQGLIAGIVAQQRDNIADRAWQPMAWPLSPIAPIPARRLLLGIALSDRGRTLRAPVGGAVRCRQIALANDQTAITWLLHRAPNMLLIPGTSSLAHLRENLAAAEISLSDRALAELDARPALGRPPR